MYFGPDSLRVDADRRLGHVRSRELRADGPPCDAPPFAFRRDDIRLLVRLDLIAFCPQVEEQLLQIGQSTGQFDWPMAIETHISYQRDDPVHGSSPGETHLLWGPTPPNQVRLANSDWPMAIETPRLQNKPYHCMIR
jgi:hypothetical protein